MRKAALFVLLLAAVACQKKTPTNVTATPRAGRTVHLSWDASTTANVTYNAYRATATCAAAQDSNFAKRNTSAITALVYDDLAVPAGTYCYYVTSYLASLAPPNESVASNKVDVTVIEQPAPPTNLIVSPAAVTVNVGGRQQFTATIDGAPATANWSVSPSDLGTIDANGLYRAPSSIKGNNVKVTIQAQTGDTTATADVTLRK